MKNFRQNGKSITIPAPSGGTIAGRLYVVGSLIGIASATVAEGQQVALETEGCFEYSKTSALAIAVGDKVYFVAANNELNKTASGNTLVGIAIEAAANPSASVVFKLGATTV